MNQSAGCPGEDVGVPDRGMGGCPPIAPLPKCGSLPVLGWFSSCFFRNNNPFAPPKPYQITHSLMMLLIKLCCLISSSEMPQTSLEQPSAHFIVVIRPFPKSVIVGHFMRQKMMSIESSLFVCTSKVLLKENTNHPILFVSFILRVNWVRVLMLLDSECVL